MEKKKNKGVTRFCSIKAALKTPALMQDRISGIRERQRKILDSAREKKVFEQLAARRTGFQNNLDNPREAEERDHESEEEFDEDENFDSDEELKEFQTPEKFGSLEDQKKTEILNEADAADSKATGDDKAGGKLRPLTKPITKKDVKATGDEKKDHKIKGNKS